MISIQSRECVHLCPVTEVSSLMGISTLVAPDIVFLIASCASGDGVSLEWWHISVFHRILITRHERMYVHTMNSYIPINVPEWAGAESEFERCWQHRFNSDSVPARSSVFAGMILPGMYTLLLYWHILSMIVCVYWYFGRMVAVSEVLLPAAPWVVIVTTSGAAGDGHGVVIATAEQCHCLWECIYECSQMVPYTYTYRFVTFLWCDV